MFLSSFKSSKLSQGTLRLPRSPARRHAELVPSHYNAAPWKCEVRRDSLRELQSQDFHADNEQEAIRQPPLPGHGGEGSLQRSPAGDLLFLPHPSPGANILRPGARPSTRGMSPGHRPSPPRRRREALGAGPEPAAAGGEGRAEGDIALPPRHTTPTSPPPALP